MPTAKLTTNELKDRIKLEIVITRRIDLKANPLWTDDYQMGYIHGLKRALELSDPKN